MEVTVEILRQASIMALLGLLVSVTPLVAGVMFAIRPNERRLALMRPLSLAGIFAGVSNLFLGVINSLIGLERVQSFDPAGLRGVFVNLAEATVPSFFAFACLTAAWLCVAVGMRRLS
jgi:hypothetical protein